MRETWTGTGLGWVEHQALFDAVFAPVTAAVLGAADLQGLPAGARVLDVGCGTGTLLDAALAAGAAPVGVDISPTMVAGARDRVPAATVLEADAQDADLLALAPGAPFARVVSRFGVMFFADPVAAFANLRVACEPGAGLVFSCWRTLAENAMFSLGTTVLTDRMGEEQVVVPDGEPGPRAFADPDRAGAVLTGAGWGSVDVEPLDVDLDYTAAAAALGESGDGVEQRLAMLLATESGRRARAALEPTLGPDGWTDLLDEVRASIRERVVAGRLVLPGAVWLVTASA